MPEQSELARLRAEIAALEAQQPDRQVNVETGPNKETPYAATAAAWTSDEYDFTTSLGHTCRLRKLRIKELAKAGILDQLTRLPGITDGLVERSENRPPKPQDAMPDDKTIDTMDDVLNKLLPMVVVQPVVYRVPAADKPRKPGVIYADMVDFLDKVEIMNKVMAGLEGYDQFRDGSEQAS